MDFLVVFFWGGGGDWQDVRGGLGGVGARGGGPGWRGSAPCSVGALGTTAYLMKHKRRDGACTHRCPPKMS